MSRLQLALNVDDLEASIAFYSRLFASEPAKVRPGYANFAVAEPPLKLVLIELHALPIRDSVYFSDARTLYDEQGRLTRPEYVQRIDEVIAQLAWYAQALRWGRANLPIPERRRS